jgi:hypothetical protein
MGIDAMTTRWKRRLVGGLAFVLLVAIFAILYVAPLRWGLIGLVRSEHFFRGYPSAYWAFELNGGDEALRPHQATQELRKGGPDAVLVLIDMLEHKGLNARFVAAQTLENMGPAAVNAVPALRRARSEENEEIVRVAIEMALFRLDRRDAVEVHIP